MQIAWLFPGQGSQKIGMGQDVIELNDAKRRFDLASNIFKRDLYHICSFENDNNSDENYNRIIVNATAPIILLVLG